MRATQGNLGEFELAVADWPALCGLGQPREGADLQQPEVAVSFLGPFRHNLQPSQFVRTPSLSLFHLLLLTSVMVGGNWLVATHDGCGCVDTSGRVDTHV